MWTNPRTWQCNGYISDIHFDRLRTVPEPETWTCEYCKSTLPLDVHNCPKCGGGSR